MKYLLRDEKNNNKINLKVQKQGNHREKNRKTLNNSCAMENSVTIDILTDVETQTYRSIHADLYNHSHTHAGIHLC